MISQPIRNAIITSFPLYALSISTIISRESIHRGKLQVEKRGVPCICQNIFILKVRFCFVHFFSPKISHSYSCRPLDFLAWLFVSPSRRESICCSASQPGYCPLKGFWAAHQQPESHRNRVWRERNGCDPVRFYAGWLRLDGFQWVIFYEDYGSSIGVTWTACDQGHGQ